jgi:GTP-dependent phosphoenolpyruvate carboxykinase
MPSGGFRYHDGLKLNVTQRLVYADDINILGGSVRTIKTNTEALIVASKENGLEANANKTNYMVMSRDQNAARSYGIKVDSISLETVEQLKYLETNRISIQEEIKSRLKSGNACYFRCRTFYLPF